MNRQQLIQTIKDKRSYLCVGLDTDPQLLPVSLQGNPDGVLLFNKAIVDATRSTCVAYKINTAFYESMGSKGWQIMEQTVQYVGKSISLLQMPREAISEILPGNMRPLFFLNCILTPLRFLLIWERTV